MELAKMEVTDRLVSMLTGESSNRVIRGELDSETRSLLRTINSEDSTFWIQEGLFRFNTLSLDRLVSKLDPEIVFIDGAYLMRPSGYSNRWAKWEIAGETAVQLKNIAMSRKVPIVCTYQFNRAAGKKDAGDVENIQLSDEIGQLISGMIGIYKLDNRRRKLSLKANRNGPVGEVEIWFDWERARFNEIVSSWRGNEERNQEVEGQG
jgi:replicative DNA helicase